MKVILMLTIYLNYTIEIYFSHLIHPIVLSLCINTLVTKLYILYYVYGPILHIYCTLYTLPPSYQITEIDGGSITHAT